MALTKISTDGVKDDAITKAKIPADQIEASELANNAVDANAIQDNAVTENKLGPTSVTASKIAQNAVSLDKLPLGNNTVDGKFLRANNGAEPTFETVSTTPADGSITQAKLNFPVANRNLVINGNFKIAQRALSHGSSGYRTVDRWKMSAGGANASLTQSQYSAISGTSPYAEGHHQAYRIDNAGQNANTQGYVYMQHHIEAQDIVSSGWNFKSSSSYITLSFWIRSSVTQTHLVSLLTNDGTLREWNHLVSLTADQWTKVTMTISGDSNITVNNDNGIGLTLYFHAYLGSHYTSTGSVDQWVTHAGYTSRPDMGAGWWTTSNATFMLTGVQLEAGSVATLFEHRPFAKELELCQRYFEKSYNYSHAVGTADNDGSVMFLSNRNSGTPHTMLRFAVRKRAVPSLTAYDPTQSNTAGMRDLDANTTYTNLAMNRAGETGCTAYPNVSIPMGRFIQFHFTADAEL